MDQLKDIIIALIHGGYFPKYSSNQAESLGKDVGKFIKAYYSEIKRWFLRALEIGFFYYIYISSYRGLILKGKFIKHWQFN